MKKITSKISLLCLTLFLLAGCVEKSNVKPSDVVLNSNEVDVKAIFNYGDTSGQQGIYKYIRQQLNYPEIAREASMEGKVFIGFIVAFNGKVKDVNVIKSSSVPSLDEEALRVMSSMPDWLPAQQNGQNVSVHYIIPISFILQ